MAVLVCALMSVSACACLDDTSRVKRDISESDFDSLSGEANSHHSSFSSPLIFDFTFFSPYLCISIHLGAKQGRLGAAG